MARAASGAGVDTAPNSILAGGPFGAAGFFAIFLAAPVEVGVLIAALVAGLICSAETAPQISNSTRPNASLCIDLGPRIPLQVRNLSQIVPAIGAPSFWRLNRLISPPISG